MKKILPKVLIIFVLIAFAAGGFSIWKRNIYQEHREIANAQKNMESAETFHGNYPVDTVLAGEKKIEKTASILFVGDLMFDRYIRQIAERKGNEFIFDKMKKMLAENDLVVANLEGPITDNRSKSVNTEIGGKGHLVFTFEKSLAKTLYEENIRLVNIGNNHILNFGKNGLEQTKQNLKEAGVRYFGNDGEEDKIEIMDIGGTKIGFANYNQFAQKIPEKTIENIKNLKSQADFVVVYTHWGTEYKSGDPGESIRKLAHQFVDFGADVVVGTHPHVVENEEEYRGKKIYYSLGNFIFDQYFSPETKKGLAVRMILDGGKMNFEKINLVLDNNGQTKADGI